MSPGAESESVYHGMFVDESLQAPSILKSIRVRGRKKGRDWARNRVGVEARELERIVERVRENLRTVDGVPFYAHFYSP